MKKYESYKESGVDWIGQIPEDWEIKKMKWITSIKRGASPRPIADTKYFDDENGEFSWVRIADVSASERYLLETKEKLSELGASLSVKRYPGDFFLSIAGSVGKPIITKIKCCIHDGFVWFPDLKINPEFLYYIFQSDLIFGGLGKVGTQLNLNTETIGNIQIPDISNDDINSIVNYLDHKTTIIDALIDKKELLIKKLQAQRQAIINEAVTKGLNKNAKMKSSGIEWLGEIPEGWVVKRISTISKLLTGFPWKSIQFNFEKGTKILRGENVSEGFLRWGTRTRFWPLEIEHDSVHWLNSNDIIIPMDGSKVGRNYVLIKETDLPIILHQRMCRLRFDSDIIAKFIEFYIGSNMFQYHVNSTKTDPMIPHITQKNIADFKIALPSNKEILQIISYCNKILESIDNALEKTKSSLSKLKTYRQSIISEAVTGKIDVRDWQVKKIE
jgi:type I restriction enzyme S subunit